MSIIDTLRNYIGNFYFRREVTKSARFRKLHNLKDAKKIGILYPLDDVPDYDIVSQLVAQFQQEHKEVKALGYVKNKQLVERFLPKLAFDFFSRKEISFFLRPLDAKVKDFIEKEFDILIDLSLTDNLPLKFISGLSAAHCRIGRFAEQNAVCYDLMIQVDPGISLKEFINHILHYLTIINSNEEKR